ncbi:MAG TPA: DUF4231 domain-containing protein [Terriglobales bacterium]|jgi:hypothetical protein|nr:DUF4231 domain-containing protein [Terriglobales bacterium]
MSDIEERIKEYIDSRLISGQTGYLGYYDRTAQRMKRRHLQNRSAAAIGAVLIPVVSNLNWEPQIRGATIHVATVGASLIGLVVALILALEGVFHFKEQWQNFRGTEQYLLSQKYRFENGVDEYQALSTEDAFKLFVSRVEKAILDENNVTLNILGRSEGISPGPPK